jgi:hypothetical protein
MKLMRSLLIIGACVVATSATAQERKDAPREYPYTAEPQYQYPTTDGRSQGRLKCPKGTKPFQGVCRKWRRVD